MGPSRSLRRLARHLAEQEAVRQPKYRRPFTSDAQRGAWVAKKAESLRRMLATWSAAHRWQQRVAEWDAEQTAELAAERRDAILRMDTKLAELGEHLRERGAQRAEAILDADQVAWEEYSLAARRWYEAFQRGELPPDSEPPRPPRPIYGAAALNELVALGITTERTARGVAAQIQEQRMGGGMHVTSDEHVDVEHHGVVGFVGLRLTADDLAEMERRAIEEMPARHAAMGFLPPDYDGPEPWELAMQERAARAAAGQGKTPPGPVVEADAYVPPGPPAAGGAEAPEGPEEGGIGAAGPGSDRAALASRAAQDVGSAPPPTPPTPAADSAAPILPSWRSTPGAPRVRYGTPSRWGGLRPGG
jgi:hypothetical protein